MINKWLHKLINDEMEIKEQLFRIILIVGTAAVGIAILQGLTLVNAANLMLVYGIMFVTFISALILTFKYRNIELSSMILGFAIIVVALPFIFLNKFSALSLTRPQPCLRLLPSLLPLLGFP